MPYRRCSFGRTKHHGVMYHVIDGDNEGRCCRKHFIVTNAFRKLKGEFPLIRIGDETSTANYSDGREASVEVWDASYPLEEGEEMVNQTRGSD